MNVTTEAPAAVPQWLRIPQAVQLYGLSRSTLYNLMTAGKIKSSAVRTGYGKKRTGTNNGARLINAASLDSFISRFATGGEEVVAKKSQARK